MLSKMIFFVQLLLLAHIQSSSAVSTLLVCGIHGTNCPKCGDEQRQCMKVRPTKTLSVADVPATACQIDPPSLQLDVGPAADDIPAGGDRPGPSEGTNDEGSGGDARAMRGGHRELPKKRKEIVVVGSRQSFQVETEVNDVTSVWWRHLQEQDDFDCRGETPPKEPLRMVRVDMLVFENDEYDCDDYQRDLDAMERGTDRGQRSIRPEIGDEVLVVYLGQKVHVLLQDVLVEGIELNLSAGGTGITQIVSLTMKEMSLYTQSTANDELELVWAREYQDFKSRHPKSP